MPRDVYRGPLKAIILDWAGTTLDFGCFAPVVVFREIFARRGVSISIAEARAPMGLHKLAHLQAIAAQPDVASRWRAVHGRDCDHEDIDSMFADFVPLQHACLGRYAELIPGCLDAVRVFRARGLGIGSSTGYLSDMMSVLLSEARKQGYEPDSSVCAEQVPAGRPEPWMCLENAKNLRAYPLEAIVKVGDTLPDIGEGLNAGMWTIGLAMTGNELGLSRSEVAALPRGELERRLGRAQGRMREAGAHYVVDSIAEVPAVLELIDERLAAGERP